MAKQGAATPWRAKQAAVPQSGVRWLKLTAPPSPGDTGVAVGVRLTAVEAQVDAMHREMKVMRALLEQRGGHGGAQQAQRADGAAESSHAVQEELFVPSDGSRWGDAIGDDGTLAAASIGTSRQPGEQVDHVTVTTEAQTDASLIVAARKVYNILSSAQRQQRSSDWSPEAHARLVAVLASEALDALGYSPDEFEDDKMLAAGGEPSGGKDIADAVMGEAPTEQDGSFSDDHVKDSSGAWSPGVYVLQGMDEHTSVQGSVARADDELESVIRMAQLCDAEAEWPIHMPKEWLANDPKRAARVMLRKALGRDVTTDDLHFTTVSKLFEHTSSRMRRTMHIATVTFKLWGHEFKGSLAGTIQEAERAAFRRALAFYHEWICWDE